MRPKKSFRKIECAYCNDAGTVSVNQEITFRLHYDLRILIYIKFILTIMLNLQLNYMNCRSFFSTFLCQSQFKYANILNSEHKSCFGNVRILLLPVKLELIHHLGTIEPWHELTKQSRLNRLSTCIIDRASIFETITNEKYFNETSVSQFELG